MSPRRRRERSAPTEVWEQLLPLFEWPEQESYEEVRPLVLFGQSVAERAEQTGASSRTLYRRIDRFEQEGMESLFDSGRAKRRKLPPAIRRLIVDVKAEHPSLSLGEVSAICYVKFGRRPSKHTVKRILAEEAWPLKMIKRFAPYHETADPRERRAAVVRLHSEGWTARSIASYLKISRMTVYRVLRRWIEEGGDGLSDKPHGRPPGVRKVDLAAIEAVRRLQENPELGAFRVHAALGRIGIELSRATCGRILAMNRRLYGMDKPGGGGGSAKKEMPFASTRRHEYWSADIRYIGHGLPYEGNVYVISILENHSRAILASSITRSQDTSAFLSVLYEAVERHGSPEALVTDSGSVFRSNRAKAIYEALGIRKEEIEKGRPWQNYAETTFNIQRRMADLHFARAGSWPEIARVHEGWVADYNGQSHWAHREREDGRRSPSEVLGWVSGVRYRGDDLERAFFSTRFSRKLDGLGYATFRRWRLYGDEGFAGMEAALWLGSESLTLEHAGEALSRYEVEHASATDGLPVVSNPTLFETSSERTLAQPGIFDLGILGESGWLKMLKLDEYSPRRPREPTALQRVLFTYAEAI